MERAAAGETITPKTVQEAKSANGSAPTTESGAHNGGEAPGQESAPDQDQASTQPPSQAPESSPSPPPQQEAWEAIETRRWLEQAVKHFHDAVQKQYGHPHQQYLDPVILRRALPNWEEAEATLRAGGAEGSTLADKLRLALDDAPLNLFIRRMNETWYALNMDIKKWYRAHEDYDKEHHDALIKQLYAVADSMMNFAGDLQAAPNNDAPTESDPTPTKH